VSRMRNGDQQASIRCSFSFFFFLFFFSNPLQLIASLDDARRKETTQRAASSYLHLSACPSLSAAVSPFRSILGGEKPDANYCFHLGDL